MNNFQLSYNLYGRRDAKMKYMNFSKANCKNCYKCLRACPVKAIKFKNEQAEIEEDRCIACGHCLSICPQNARNVISDLDKVKYIVNSSRPVIAALAPSFAGFFDVEEGKVIKALKKLGFSNVYETAYGAEIVAKLYNKYVEEHSQENYITTSCPSANYLVEKYYPELVKYMIPVVSPMLAIGKILKRDYGKESFVVFIGPCHAKKIELEDYKEEKIIDGVITFEEVKLWLKEENIDLDELEASEFEYKNLSGGRSFPLGGGILECMGGNFKNKSLNTISVTGIEDCMEIFKSMKQGKVKNYFVEVSSCKGSCIGGPKMVKDEDGYYTRFNKVRNYIDKRVNAATLESITFPENITFYREFKDKSLIKEVCTKEELNKILRQMGKFSEEDELNCGVCGYNTCREKAQAIYEGMAETSMCLHFMRSKAEGLSNVIIESTPNCLILLDEDMKIREINPAAEKTFLVHKENIMGKPISILLEDEDFRKVKKTGKSITGKKVIYGKYNAVFIENALYLEKQDVVLVSLVNIIDEEKNREELIKIKRNALNAADEIIEKQMRVAQEIAGVLGETTAETKLILMELRKVISGES